MSPLTSGLLVKSPQQMVFLLLRSILIEGPNNLYSCYILLKSVFSAKSDQHTLMVPNFDLISKTIQ